MRILYFDCFSGISGDMAIGALLNLGIEKSLFRQELAKLNLSGYELIIDKKIINGITGTDVKVVLYEVPEHDHGNEHGSHSHVHGKAGHSHNHSERNLKDIETIIDWSDLSTGVKDLSKRVFGEIARAEARVHDKDINEVHFHEVGAIDSIVDIVGTAICLELLGIEKVFSSPLHDGSGFIECRHGIIPVPVPAVMEMLSGSGIPLISENIGTELVTPTGMGLIKCLSAGFGSMPAMTVEKTGYGMGKRETGRLNALRVVLGTTYVQGHTSACSTPYSDEVCPCFDGMDDEIAILETNIDDMSPEILGYTAVRLLDNGALDVFYTPIYMKKNRPAFMLTVLTDRINEDKLADLILKETTTLGIRRSTSVRYCMNREIIKVTTEWGEVRVKVASRGDFKKAAPEFEDCRLIAEKTGIPLAKIYETVIWNAGKL